MITAGKFDRGFYVFNLAPFNGLGTTTARLPIIWASVRDTYVWVLLQILLCVRIREIQKQI
jgi:hypothetical protein